MLLEKNNSNGKKVFLITNYFIEIPFFFTQFVNINIL